MNVLDFVLKIDNVLPDDVCDELIKLFEESEHKDRLERGGYPNWTNLFICNHHPKAEEKLNNVYLAVARKYQEWLGEYGLYFNTRHFDFEGSNIKKYVGGTDDVYKRHADVGCVLVQVRDLLQCYSISMTILKVERLSFILRCQLDLRKDL